MVAISFMFILVFIVCSSKDISYFTDLCGQLTLAKRDGSRCGIDMSGGVVSKLRLIILAPGVQLERWLILLKLG